MDVGVGRGAGGHYHQANRVPHGRLPRLRYIMCSETYILGEFFRARNMLERLELFCFGSMHIYEPLAATAKPMNSSLDAVIPCAGRSDSEVLRVQTRSHVTL